MVSVRDINSAAYVVGATTASTNQRRPNPLFGQMFPAPAQGFLHHALNRRRIHLRRIRMAPAQCRPVAGHHLFEVPVRLGPDLVEGAAQLDGQVG